MIISLVNALFLLDQSALCVGFPFHFFPWLFPAHLELLCTYLSNMYFLSLRLAQMTVFKYCKTVAYAISSGLQKKDSRGKS